MNDRPNGLSDDEWSAVLDVRTRKEREAELASHWREILAELDVDNDSDEDSWDQAANTFSHAVEHYGDWDQNNLEEFTYALMRSQGWRNRTIRGHGIVWKST